MVCCLPRVRGHHATRAHCCSRYLFRDWVESTLKTKWKRWEIIDKAIEHDGWKLVLIMRFSPIIPYNLVRLAAMAGRCWAMLAAAAVRIISGARPLLPGCCPNNHRVPPCPLPAAQHCHGHHVHPLLAVHGGVGSGHHLRMRCICLLWQVRCGERSGTLGWAGLGRAAS